MTNRSVFIANRGGTPIVTAPATVGTANVTIDLPNHVFRFLGAKGIIIVEATPVIPTGTTGTLPVLVSTNGASLPLVSVTGAAVTSASLVGVTYIEVLFNKSANTLTLMSPVA